MENQILSVEKTHWSHNLTISILDLLALLVFYILISLVPIYLFLFYFLHDGSLTTNVVIESVNPVVNLLTIVFGTGILYALFRRPFQYQMNVFFHGIIFAIFYVFVYSFLLLTNLHDLILSGPGQVLSVLYLITLYFALINLLLVHKENRSRSETFKKKVAITFLTFMVLLFLFVYWYGFFALNLNPSLNFMFLMILIFEFFFLVVFSTLVFYKLFFGKGHLTSREIAYSPLSLFVISLGGLLILLIFEYLLFGLFSRFLEPISMEALNVIDLVIKAVSFFAAAFIYMGVIAVFFKGYKFVRLKIHSKNE
ncbi:hypothetical protein [Methanolapillus millepedarum]|uniref:Uncharacterized protein n=1 Tax=Methanolapillus millepedarum TaxID=3028296 RepID=A0AA96VFZ0_9EURY|nr:hypothetical protein MsAc7_14420 [Methanosarcinaceae archaeon Ac7]